MTSLGSIRRSDCAEAELVLANGVYLVFRLAMSRSALKRNLVEVSRKRKGSKHGDSILLDARLLSAARADAFRAIMAHRAGMRLPPPPIELRLARPYQLRFVF